MVNHPIIYNYYFLSKKQTLQAEKKTAFTNLS